MIRRYAKYKDSGVAWIGEIPEGWECLMIKRLSPVRRGASPRPIHDPKYFDNEGEFAWVRIADVSASERYLENTTQTLSELGASLSVKRYPGDLFLSIAGTVGKPIISKIKCCIHDGFVYFPKLELNAEYLYYLFSTGLPYQGLGKWGTQLNLNTDTVGEIVIPIPSKSEMSDVVAFIDRKTAKIDQLIARKEKLIAFYEEEITAVINRAVTRGLDPKVTTKPTGVDWLGDIPEHWEVKRLKYLTSILNDGTHGSFKRTTSGYRLLSVRNIINDEFVFLDDDSRISEEDFDIITKPFIVVEGDLQLAIVGATLGKVAIVPNLDEKFATQRSVATIRTKQEMVHNKFLFYFLKSSSFQSFLWLNAGFSAQPGIYLGALANCHIPTPRLTEQIVVVAHIETECSRLDTIIDKFKKQIELFKEYRTTMISEVVTGKIDVREEVAA